MTRTLIPASLTWALTVATLFLLGTMFRTPPSNAHLAHAAAPRHHATRTSNPPVFNPDAAGTPSSADGPLTDPYRTWSPPSTRPDTPDAQDPVADPAYQAPPRYQADSRHTTVDSRSTHIDPAHTAVDHQSVSIDPHITTIDPRAIGIDPRLTSP